MKKQTWTSAPHGTFDYAAIGKVLREQLGGNFPGIKPDEKPLVSCELCPASYNPNTKLWGAGCSGKCCG